MYYKSQSKLSKSKLSDSRLKDHRENLKVILANLNISLPSNLYKIEKFGGYKYLNITIFFSIFVAIKYYILLIKI